MQLGTLCIDHESFDWLDLYGGLLQEPVLSVGRSA